MTFKKLLVDLMNKSAVINSAEVGVKTTKEKDKTNQTINLTETKSQINDKATEKRTLTQEADQTLKKYRKNFMI